MRQLVEAHLQHNNGMATIDVASLSFEERLRLLDELWESLSRTPEAIPLTEAQRAELDRRLNELESEGAVGIPWNEVLGRIRSRSKWGNCWSAPQPPRISRMPIFGMKSSGPVSARSSWTPLIPC